ncbi:hypothetical protein SH668x_003691 [Planctomicrobium sp. SH668]|jgi:hypothetical protein|uniref:hypothetical protein n=1 Tax=Planctomicrobium sp. SH668 TaxID=3448126 RepID=UPI003F5B9DDD
MKKTMKTDAICPRKTYSHDLGNGVRLEGEVSPCVFMYPRYPLQVEARLRNAAGTPLGKACAVNRSLTAETATDADVSALLSTIRTMPCIRCSGPAFNPTTVDTNRGGLCESCFVADLDAELARFSERERRKLAKQDCRMKAKGMRVRVSVWVHPAVGDDYQADWYFPAQPTPAQLQRRLRDEGSELLDDYQIITL